MEPLVGFEPTTYSLRMNCSTPELQRPFRISPVTVHPYGKRQLRRVADEGEQVSRWASTEEWGGPIFAPSVCMLCLRISRTHIGRFLNRGHSWGKWRSAGQRRISNQGNTPSPPMGQRTAGMRLWKRVTLRPLFRVACGHGPCHSVAPVLWSRWGWNSAGFSERVGLIHPIQTDLPVIRVQSLSLPQRSKLPRRSL